jgi:DNA-binding MarR family transcriptional regulator
VAGPPVPEDVARLLSSSIDSVAELEVLLFLHKRPDAEWDPKAVADLLYMDRALSLAIFKKLHARGFLTFREQPSLLYRYAPPRDMLAALDKLAALYAERRMMVIALIAARRPSGLQLFSNAFRLRGSGGTSKPGGKG